MAETKESNWKTFGNPRHTLDYYNHTRRKTYKEALDEIAEKHSQFMKPYITNDYHDMIHWYPDPNPGGTPWLEDPDFNGPGPDDVLPGEDVPRPGGPAPEDTGDCVCCLTIVLGPCQESDGSDGWNRAEWWGVFNPGVPFGDFTIKGDVKNVTMTKTTLPHRVHTLQWQWDSSTVVGDDAFASVTYSIKDVCSKTYDPLVGDGPCACNRSTPVAYDRDNSADTVAPEASASVAVTGLGKPFTWAISGTGTWSMSNAETDGLTNTVNAGADACGTATITITDCDGNVATGYIRSTGGQWSDWAEVDAIDIGVTCPGHDCKVSTSGITPTCAGLSDKYEWRVNWEKAGAGVCTSPDCCSSHTDGGVCYYCITLSDGPCTHSPIEHHFCLFILQRREWECVP